MFTTEGASVHLVDNTDRFTELCNQWRSNSVLAIDTEFVRTNTFYPKTGLIQIADASNCYLIDPLEIDDWTGFKSLLEDPDVQFVIHSCSEDLNLLQTSLECVPRKLFDTQIAAAFLGLGFSLSYQALVNQILGKELDKGETRSNWLLRPLRDTQLLYAANDVCHLLELQSILSDQLSRAGRSAWFEDECAAVLGMTLQIEDAGNWESQYIGVSNAWKLSGQGLIYLQNLCHWREVTARKRDKPRSWIARDADLLSIAKQLPDKGTLSIEALRSIKLTDSRLLGRYASQLLAVLSNDEEEFAAIDRSQLNVPFKSAMRSNLKACQKCVAQLAEELQLAPELLARKKLLQDLIREFDRSGKLIFSGEMSGWRQQILEPAFTQILLPQQPSTD
ncbi:MAG: ribonuclease D [Gammaproteobacteria bacterium]|jgi:ribonuclease D|nr:ribonuclease D [Gammaproteobacteria bacterium]MDP6732280.1 ribonuclease D [Gammaproteobacteria bacterium]|tara:strand:+ start:398 stop:1570 length:1173 start_codon:yes stop_codon:yes gene_type:complete